MSVRRKIAIVAITIAGLLGAAGATAATTGGGAVNASAPTTHYWGLYGELFIGYLKWAFVVMPPGS